MKLLKGVLRGIRHCVVQPLALTHVTAVALARSSGNLAWIQRV